MDKEKQTGRTYRPPHYHAIWKPARDADDNEKYMLAEGFKRRRATGISLSLIAIIANFTYYNYIDSKCCSNTGPGSCSKKKCHDGTSLTAGRITKVSETGPTSQYVLILIVYFSQILLC